MKGKVKNGPIMPNDESEDNSQTFNNSSSLIVNNDIVEDDRIFHSTRSLDFDQPIINEELLHDGSLIKENNNEIKILKNIGVIIVLSLLSLLLIISLKNSYDLNKLNTSLNQEKQRLEKLIDLTDAHINSLNSRISNLKEKIEDCESRIDDLE